MIRIVILIETGARFKDAAFIVGLSVARVRQIYQTALRRMANADLLLNKPAVDMVNFILNWRRLIKEEEAEIKNRRKYELLDRLISKMTPEERLCLRVLIKDKRQVKRID